MNTSANRPLTMRARGVPVRPCVPVRLLLRCGFAYVNVLISATVGPKWSTGKVQCHDDSVVRFGPGAAAPARPWQRQAAAIPAGSGPARADRGGPAARRRAAALTPGPGPGAGPLPRPGAGVLPPAAVRGLPAQPHRLGNPGRDGCVPGTG